MNIEPQTLMSLTELLCVLMRHDPVVMARVASHFERRAEPRFKQRNVENDDS